jgi:hypothetical protein
MDEAAELLRKRGGPKPFKTGISALANAPCIMHDIAAAGLYGPPHPLYGGV